MRFFVKKHLKVLKNLFAKYANTTGPINTVQHTFEDLHKLNANMTVSEAMKMLKDFNVSTLQASQKDVMAMFRAINKDILKKKDAKKNLQNALMTAIDFEGFVEFLMQIAVHLYSFDSAMTPVEYLGKLFETFTKSSSNIGKLFLPGNAEEGQLHSGVVDNKLLAELNRRLSYDPSYQLPEGFSKVIEREIENKYSIPTYFPIKHSKRVVVEVLDGFLNELFGIHILEPMAEVIEHARAHPILKHMVRDKVMSEVGLNANK